MPLAIIDILAVNILCFTGKGFRAVLSSRVALLKAVELDLCNIWVSESIAKAVKIDEVGKDISG